MIATQLPAPDHPQDFERLCRALFAAKWPDGGWKRIGSNGERQHGVDVHGQPGGSSVGVQCKLRDESRGRRLRPAEIVAEVTAARAFAPTLDRFVIVTTAPRSDAAGSKVRELNEDPAVPFEVELLAWDDLRELLEDEHTAVRNRFYGLSALGEADARELRSYMQALWEKLRVLPIAAFDSPHERDPTLDVVYTELDVDRTVSTERLPANDGSATDEFGSDRDRSVALATGESDAYEWIAERLAEAAGEPGTRRGGRRTGAAGEPRSRKLRAIEFLACQRHAVLLGAPGSGKSAFLRWVALCMAGEYLRCDTANLRLLAPEREGEGLSSADVWPHGMSVPLLVDLRRLVADTEVFPKTESDPVHAGILLDHLIGPASAYPISVALRQQVVDALLGDNRAGRGVVLLLDGLDETPDDRDGSRARLRRVIQAFRREYPAARMIVTSRPYAYQPGCEWWLEGFAAETLDRLSSDAITRFVDAWYRHSGREGVVPGDQVEPGIQRLLRALRNSGSLRDLATRPLSLTLLTLLHVSGRLVEGDRAAVLEAAVQLFFDRWNEFQLGEDQQSFQQRFELDRAEVRGVLQRVALEVHEKQGAAETNEAAPIALQIISDHLEEASDGRPIPERRLVEYLERRSGILLAEGDRTYRFPHRSFQEYLAACALADDEDYPEPLVGRAVGDPLLWREVIAFCLLRCGLPGGEPQRLWTIAEDLLDENGTKAASRLDIVVATTIAGRESARRHSGRARGSRRDRVLRTLRERTVELLELGGLRAVDRIAAGEALGRLGDPRIAPDRFEKNLLPVKLGSGTRMGRYPVTVQEFEAFIDAGGYGDDRWWEPDGGVSRPERKEGAPAGWTDQREHRNRPVVGVSWWESMAWCRWKSAEMGIELRLPTHKEWEAAAMHPAGAWPWGEEEPSDERANYGGQVGHPSPVGSYPLGAGQAGHLDLGGNVWEWVDDRETPGQGDMSESWRELLRGGSWPLGSDSLRSVSRYDSPPDVRGGGIGFRVCAPASRPSTLDP